MIFLSYWAGIRPQITLTMAVADETAGMIKGLAEVVQNQQILQNTAMKETTAQLQQLSETVATLTQSLPPAGSTSAEFSPA